MLSIGFIYKIYINKKIGYFPKQPIFEKTNIFTYYIYKSILFV